MLSAPDLQTYQTSTLTRNMKAADAEVLLAMSAEALYTAGQELFHHRLTDGDLFLILDGKVNILTDDGDKIIEVGPGGIVGEISFLDAGTRDASAVAVNYVTALRFPSADLRKKMCGDKEFGFRVLCNIAQVMCARMREAEDKLDALMDHAHEAWNTWDK